MGMREALRGDGGGTCGGTYGGSGISECADLEQTTQMIRAQNDQNVSIYLIGALMGPERVNHRNFTKRTGHANDGSYREI